MEHEELSAPLIALQVQLDQVYRELLAGNPERRVFVLEHRLSAEQRHQLFQELSNCLPQVRPDSPVWRAHPLPLLVAAAEVGYDYRGTGTDFWPQLQERLGYGFRSEDRHILTEAFVDFATQYQGARPADTPWNHRFCHIAWPVHHAVLPLEFHRPLMTALAGLTLRVRSSTRSEEVVGELQRWASAHGPKRFLGWLADTELAADISRELLDMAQEGRRLEPKLLERLHQDLEQDEAAVQELKVARERQAQLGKSTPQSVASSQRVLLRLMRTGGELRLLLALPGLTGPRVEETRLALRRQRFMPRPWGLGAPLHSESLLMPGLVPLRLERLPESGTPLLPGLEALSSKSAQELLRRLDVDLTPPLIFRVSDEGEQASQLQGRALRPGQRYWLLVGPGEARALGVTEGDKRGEVAGLTCVQVEAGRPSQQRWLEARGFTLAERPSLSWVGAPPLNPYAEPRAYDVEDCVVLRLTRVPPEGARVEVRSGERARELRLEAESLLLVEGASGEVGALVETGTRRRELSARIVRTSSSPVSPAAGLTLSLEPAGPTLQDLLHRRCTLRIDSLLPLEAPVLRVSLSWGGRVRGWAELRPLSVPVVLGPDSLLWEELLPSALLERLTRQERLILRASVGALSSEEWSLEQEVASLGWEEPEGTVPRAFTEAGPVALQAVSASEPLDAPVPLAEQAHPLEGVSLLFPVPAEGQPLFTGRCVGPARLHLDAELPRRPERLLRQLEGRGRGRAGVRQVTEAYLHWALAQSSSLVLEHRRRQVVACLEGWGVEQLCGESWARRESTALAQASADPWSALVALCRERRLGFGAVTLSAADEERLAAWLRRELRAELSVFPRAGEELFAGLPEWLDNLLIRGLTVVVEQARRQEGGQLSEEEVEELDISNSDEEWSAALSEARSRVELPSLRRLLYPAGGSELPLQLDLVSTAPEEVEEELIRWVRETQGVLGTPRWREEELQALLSLWLAPRTALRLEWLRALERGLADHATARVLRYAALRLRLARSDLGQRSPQGSTREEASHA